MRKAKNGEVGIVSYCLIEKIILKKSNGEEIFFSAASRRMAEEGVDGYSGEEVVVARDPERDHGQYMIPLKG